MYILMGAGRPIHYPAAAAVQATITTVDHTLRYTPTMSHPLLHPCPPHALAVTIIPSTIITPPPLPLPAPAVEAPIPPPHRGTSSQPPLPREKTATHPVPQALLIQLRTGSLASTP